MITYRTASLWRWLCSISNSRLAFWVCDIQQRWESLYFFTRLPPSLASVVDKHLLRCRWQPPCFIVWRLFYLDINSLQSSPHFTVTPDLIASSSHALWELLWLDLTAMCLCVCVLFPRWSWSFQPLPKQATTNILSSSARIPTWDWTRSNHSRWEESSVCVSVCLCVSGVQRSDNTPTIHSQNAPAAEQWW